MKEFKYLTKSESLEFCGAVCDIETGNYLINKRPKERLHVIQELIEALNADNPNERQSEIIEWQKVCTDYFYAKENGYLDHNDRVADIQWKDLV